MTNADSILQAIKDYWRENAIPPTIRALQEITGINSTSLIRSYCLQLEKAGEIKRIRSKPVPVKIYKAITGESSQ
jgi:SOS-response transcriptional repressor LexA